MAEQWLEAWIVDADALAGVIGGKDHDLVARASRGPFADAFRERIDDAVALEDALRAIVDGPEPTRAEWHNRRFMKLFAEALGTRVDNEPTLPGRGWQELAPAFAHWKMPHLARLWERPPAWADGVGFAGYWPRIVWAPPFTLAALIAELEAFDKRLPPRLGMPSSVPRFGEGDWEMDELADVVAMFTAELAQWARAAVNANLALFVWIEGAQ